MRLGSSAAALIAAPQRAGAATRTWTGLGIPNSWSDPNNWSPVGVPGNVDAVYIPGISTADTTVAYNYAGSPVSLNQLHLSHGNASAAGTATSTLVLFAGFTLNSGPEYVGDSSFGGGGPFGRGRITHPGGTNITSDLILGYQAGDTGYYTLTTTGALIATNALIGFHGTGSFGQSGGTHTTSFLSVGHGSGSAGTYNLSAGRIVANGPVIVGRQGTGTFVQSGGTLAPSAGQHIDLTLGLEPGTNGSYSLSGVSVLTTADVRVGQTGAGAFVQSGGTHTAASLVIADFFGSSGSYALGGGTLGNAGPLIVGNTGPGTFAQTGGVHTVAGPLILANQPGSSGTFDLAGGTLTLNEQLTIGQAGPGAFNLSGGAKFTQSGEYGTTVGVNSIATLAGADSQWKTHQLFLSGDGAALIVDSGAAISDFNGFIGFASNSSAVVAGAGSSWSNTNGLWVGGTSGGGSPGGTGALSIHDGASVSAGFAFIAGWFNGVGNVTVAGAGASLNLATDLSVGPLGNATLNIETGGTVSVGGIFYAGGTTHLSGGTLDVKTFRFNNGGTFNWTGGTLAFETYEGNLAVPAGGTVAPKHGTGVVSLVQGTYSASNTATLAMEIGGPPAQTDKIDFLRVTGNASLAGTLHLALTNGFIPQPRDAFPIFQTFGTRTGTFASVTGYSIAPGQDFAVHYINSAIIARAGEWHNPHLDGVIDVPGAKLDVTGNLSWPGVLTKQGPGTLSVDSTGGTSTVASNARLDVLAGQVLLKSDVGATSPNLRVRVIGGSLAIESTQRLASLEVNDSRAANVPPNGQRVLKTAALDLHSTGRLDLTNNKLVVVGGDLGTFDGASYSGLTGRIASAYNFSSWDGPGIATSQFDAGPLRSVTTLAIATADEVFYAGGTFGGVSVASGDVLVMYTYAGDLNLDGLIDGADYGAIDNWVQFPGTSGYANGDINYDGVIDGADYGIIDNAVQLQGDPFPAGTYPQAVAGASVTAVPEPAAGVAAGLVAAPLLAVRRRRRSR